MSALSSDGRPSFSSEPSFTSSHTFNSKTSDTYVDNGEGGSSHAPSTSSRHREGAVDGDYRVASRGSGNSLLSAEAVEEQDFAHRRHHVSRSGGGFLLDSSFLSGPRSRHSTRPPHTPDAKGKTRLRQSRTPTNDTLSKYSSEQRASPGNSPLAQRVETEGETNPLRVRKTRSSMLEVRPAEYSKVTPGTAPRLAVDPNQLVHMALNLSESRRRNISASQLLGSQPRTPSRAQQEGSFSNAGVGSSLRQYLNEQRRVSRNISPMGGRGSPSRHISASMQRGGSMSFPASQTISPSVATLLRRDKARAYIELRAEYMRLLDFLPPLKADAGAPGNFIYTSNAVPGSPQAQLTRTPSYANKQHELGRPYNPIQALRNRRSRARERLALPQEPAEFSDTEQVHTWIDQIEEQSKRPGYRREDGVSLPKLHDDHDMQIAQVKPSKTQQGWSFTPEELLADAYWLEQGDNKLIIEDRNGRKIFPAREPQKSQKHDLLQPRPSKDYSDKRRRSWVDSVSGTAADPTTGDESEHGSERGRKRRLLPRIRTESRLRAGRGSPRKHSVGYSDSSDSDTDVRKIRKSFDIEHNTGPLALQMKKQLELQTKGISSKPPAVFTPDTPDKWGRAHDDIPDGKVSRNSLDVPRLTNGPERMDENGALNMPSKSRGSPLSPIKSAEPRSSIDDQDSTAPSTPLHARHFPHTGSDLSPPPSRAGSDLGKTKRSRLKIFHSSHDHEDKHEQIHEPEVTSMDKKHGSRQTSEEPQESSSLGNAIFAAPGAVKNLLSHRKNESISSLPSPDKLRRKEIQDFKEPHSAVTRFFKGVKHEGTKVGDIIFRRDRADDTDASTVSDRNSIEFHDDDTHNSRAVLSRTVTSTTTGSDTSEKDGRSHLKLPSFRPVHKTLGDDNDASDLEHHISRQSRERRNTRSLRIDRLLPPRMDLERVPTASSTATLAPIRSHDQDRMNKQLARPGGVNTFSSTLPPTALREAQGKHRSTSRPTLDGKRHWSIADDNGEHTLHRRKRHNAVFQADIARVRALFICSGVKAKEIARRAQTPSSHTPGFLTLAAEAAKEELFPVPKKEEHVLAARMLVYDLERSTSTLHNACEHFQSGTIKDLNARIIHLRDSIENDLMPRIFENGDKAVRVTSEVSGQGSLQVKQINDEIDRMLRQRRRHTRWVMSWGWSAVEWTIVVALRFASVIFAVYGLLKSIIGMIWGVIKWLLWL